MFSSSDEVVGSFSAIWRGSSAGVSSDEVAAGFGEQRSACFSEEVSLLHLDSLSFSESTKEFGYLWVWTYS